MEDDTGFYTGIRYSSIPNLIIKRRTNKNIKAITREETQKAMREYLANGR